MANALVRQNESLGDAMEQVAVGGDLSALTATQRVSYYQKVCESVGLNPFTRPFEYLKLNGKLVLYARRDAADQLRTIHGISISKPVIDYQDDLIIVSVEATNRDGRTDADLGVVGYKGLQGEAKANAIMKAITKAKRRVTLSLAGLGWLDETEIDSIPGAQRVDVDKETGEIIDGDVLFSKSEQSALPVASQRQLNKMHAVGMEYYGSKDRWDKARPVWTQNASDSKATSSRQLSPEQVDWVIERLEGRIARRADEVQANAEMAEAA